mgnify:CR=1 FL=1
MPKVNFTKSFIEKGLICPEDKTKIEYVSKDFPGFYIEVRATSQPHGTYYCRYKIRSRPMSSCRIGRTNEIKLTDALKKAKAIKEEVALGGDPKAKVMKAKKIPTLQVLFNDHYLPHAKQHKRTWINDEQMFNSRLDEKFGHLKLTAISKSDVQKFHLSLSKYQLSASTCDHYVKLIRRLLNFAKDLELIQRNPLDRFKLFREENYKERYLNTEEQAQLVKKLKTDANRPVCNLVLFLLATGARRSEVFKAEWQHFDLENRVWRIPSANSKSKKMRSVPLNDFALKLLTDVGTQGKFDYAFANPATGNPYKCIKKAWTRLREQAGLPELRLHDLRHQFASLLVNSGRSLYEVQHILGHSDPTVTQRYAHLSTATLQEASNAASKLIE